LRTPNKKKEPTDVASCSRCPTSTQLRDRSSARTPDQKPIQDEKSLCLLEAPTRLPAEAPAYTRPAVCSNARCSPDYVCSTSATAFPRFASRESARAPLKVQELLLHFTGSQPTSPTIHPARTFSLHTVCSTETQGSKKSSQQGLSHSQDQQVPLQQNHHLLEPHRRSRRSLALWTEAQAHGRDEARGQTRLQEPASPDRACFVT
jgi:hypothetical protein